jgi:hypothetical protein
MSIPYENRIETSYISLVLFCEFLEFCLDLLWLIILEGYYHGAEN